jgi:hypothetical protein
MALSRVLFIGSIDEADSGLARDHVLRLSTSSMIPYSFAWAALMM